MENIQYETYPEWIEEVRLLAKNFSHYDKYEFTDSCWKTWFDDGLAADQAIDEHLWHTA